MFRKTFHLIFSVFLILGATVFANAQGAEASSRSGVPQKEELPSGIKESLAKQRIEREKKDYKEMLDRSEEALKLSEQLEKSYAQHNQFSSEDVKKLERLEKVVKKIRSEMGGGDDGAEEDIEKPSSIANALSSMKEGASKLVEELKKTSRYSVSVIAVQSSNALINVVQFLRFRKN